MSSAWRARLRRGVGSVLAFALGVVALPVVASSGSVANAMVTAQCTPTVDFFVSKRTDSEMYLRRLQDPASGDRLFSEGGVLGTGWNDRFLAGPSGYVYTVATTGASAGQLHRRRWLGTAWEGNASTYQVVGQGWSTWGAAPHRTRITVDSNNNFYRVALNGNLELAVHNAGTNAFTVTVIDTQTDWRKYDQLVAAGDGVLYARAPAAAGGAIYRTHYDFRAGTFLQKEANLGGDWNGFRWIASAGADVLYALHNHGGIWWVRYSPEENRYTESAYGETTQHLADWPDVDEFAVTVDGCKTGTVAPDIKCKQSANYWGFTNDNKIWLRPHTEPETGITAWEKPAEVATGWARRFVSGPNGYKYFVSGGELRRHRWQNGTWDTSVPLASGWGEFEDPRYKYRFTVDAAAAFYLVPSSGNLERRVHDATAATWSGEVLDTGWGRFDQVFAAGDGVLYARDPAVENGAVYRYHYDTRTRRWLDYGTKVATGWNKYHNLTSPGADVIYANEGPYVDWLRWDVTAKRFATGAEGTTAEHIWWWADLREISADIDSCTLVTPPNPALPTLPAPSAERAQLVHNSALQRLEVAYVDDSGVLRHGYQTAPGTEVMAFRGLSGFQAHTGRAGIVQRQDGRMVVGATSADGQADTYTQDTVGGDHWTGPVLLQGGFPTSPVVVRGANNLLTAFAVSDTGKLWYTEQFDVTGGFRPWRQASHPNNGYTMTANFTVVPSGDGFEIAYHNPSGVPAVTRFRAGALSPLRVAGGITGVGTPGAVVFTDGKVQLVSRGSNNKLYTQKEGASGFTGWVDISDGLTFTGSPGALLNPHGIVEVVVRTADGVVHRGGQTAPGATTWRAWESSLQDSVTDPAVAAATGSEERAFFRDGSGNAYLWQLTAYTSSTAPQPSATLSKMTVAPEGGR